MSRKAWRCWLTLGALALLAANVEAAVERAPNIVILLADDLGRGDLGYTGSDIKTPNIDKLVATGVRLDRFYSCPMCSPTRAGLMTGRWPIRYGLMKAVIPPWSEYGLPVEERTLPQALGEAGYERRGMFGKWHLGHSRRTYLPLARGFTEFYGHYNGAIDYITHVREGEVDWHRNERTVKEEGYATDLIAREATRFVEQSPADKPFFLYVPFNAPHSPFQAKPEDLAKYPQRQGNRRAYAAMVDAMDQGIGKILAAIERRADAANTFVLFFSDNGGVPQVSSNAGLRAGKLTVYEGGVRVAAAVRWPQGGLAGGKVCSEMIGYIDVMPTALRLAGAKADGKARPFDGRDVLEAMRGSARLPERPWYSYYAQSGDALAAVCVGDWKLVVKGGDVLSAQGDPTSKVELFNLAEDLAEKNNLAAAQPERVAKLRAQLAELGRMEVKGVGGYAEGREGFKAPKDWVITKE